MSNSIKCDLCGNFFQIFPYNEIILFRQLRSDDKDNSHLCSLCGYDFNKWFKNKQKELRNFSNVERKQND